MIGAHQATAPPDVLPLIAACGCMLQGKGSCHTGYRKTAGWMMPVGYMTGNDVVRLCSVLRMWPAVFAEPSLQLTGDRKLLLTSVLQIPRVDDNDEVQADAESVASFFSTTCAAGTGALLSGGTWDGQCTGCKVWSPLAKPPCRSQIAPHAALFIQYALLFCQRHQPAPAQGDCTEADPYYDYAGSVRCLMEGAGALAAASWLELATCCGKQARSPAARRLQAACQVSSDGPPYRRVCCPAGGVAFTKHITPLQYAKDGTEPDTWSTLNKVRFGRLPHQQRLLATR